MAAARPDYLLILPWNLRDELMAQLAFIRDVGRPLRPAHPSLAGAAMKFIPTLIPGVTKIELQPQADERGSFARTYDEAAFRAHGLEPVGIQCNISVNAKRGTLRGLHYQAAPAEEAKLVSCARGRLFDVAVDLRPDSPAFRQWLGVELDADDGPGPLHPPRLRPRLPDARRRHGGLLSNGGRVRARARRAASAGTIPPSRISWPFAPLHLSDRDAAFPDFES